MKSHARRKLRAPRSERGGTSRKREFGVTDAVPAARPPPESSVISGSACGSSAGNGTSHRGKKAAQRLAALYPNLVLVHLPVHASWLDQIEIYFSIVQRKVLTPNDPVSLAELERRILDFQARYEESATPFEWKFTRRDLDKLLRRIAAHERLRAAA